MPADVAGVARPFRRAPTRSGEGYFYSYIRTLSDLYLVDGVK